MKFSTDFYAATREYSTFETQISAPCFRREFELCGLETAELTLCGLGLYELLVNGEKITKGLLSPYISNPDDILYYDNYDLTPHLREGKNVIGIMLGNGNLNAFGGEIWNFHNARYRSAPKLALTFEAKTSTGDVEFDARDFVCTESPIILDDLRIGEWYDARLELGDWTSPGYDQTNWRISIPAETPRGECRLCGVDPILPLRELSPISYNRGRISHLASPAASLPIFEAPDDESGEGYLYDFGIDTAGIVHLTIKNARPGQKIVLQYGEKIADGGLDLRMATFLPTRFNHRDIYICKGGDESWSPSFSYHGFRYILVLGLDENQATKDLLTYVVMSSAVKPRASFECSDEVTNKLWEITLNSDLSNFYHFPTDCPQREKNGWTGDISVSAEQLIMAFSCERNLAEWSRNLCKSMRPSGDLPGIVPTYEWGYGHGPAWDGVLINLPYYIWLYRGDTQLMRENASAILRWIHFVRSKRDSNGLVTYGLGDWVPAGRYLDYRRAPTEFTSTVITLDLLKKAAKIYEILEMRAEKAYCESFYAELYAAAREHLIDKSRLVALGNCQTTQAMAIYYNLFEGAERSFAFEHLLELIAADGETCDCGVLGMRVIFHVLSEFGRSDLAFKLITQEEFPSYGYMISKGATALWECIHRFENQSSSLNHHFFGDIISWFMRNLAGIQINPHERDANEIRLAPSFVGALDFVKASVEIPAGVVSVDWRREGETVLLRYEIPAGTKAELHAEPGLQFEDGIRFRRLYGSGEVRLIDERAHDSGSRK